MKKIMFMLALLAAVAVQAASITWGVGNNAFSLESGSSYSSKSGVLVYLIDAAAKDSIVAAIGAGKFSSSTEGVLASKATTNTKGYIAQYEVTSPALTAGKYYDFSALILDTIEGKTYYNITSAVHQNAYTSGIDEQMKINFASTQFANGTGWTEASGTPEPTSGLLLLLGGAMLALRRKQK